MNPIIKRLNKAISMKRISVKECSIMTGVPEGTLRHILSGRPSYKILPVIDKLCSVLGISPNWLINGKENRENISILVVH